MSEIVISIIVPVYNVESYLKRCLDSLVNQDFDYDYEIILVDDGSKDNSGLIAEDYSKKYSNIRCYHKNNGGLSSARNYGLEHAEGKYITYVDSDDYVSNTYLKDMYSLANMYDADIVVTHVCLVTEEGANSHLNETFGTRIVNSKDAFWYVYIVGEGSWSGYAKLTKKEIAEKHKFPAGYFEELASTYLYLSEANKVVIADLRNNYHYIRRSGSIVASKLSNKHLRIFEVCDEIFSYIKTTYPKWEKYSALIYQNATLQLLTRVNMSKDDYKTVFNKAVSISRKYLIPIMFDKNISLGKKYYALLLSTNSTLFRIQRAILIKIGLIKIDWLEY